MSRQRVLELAAVAGFSIFAGWVAAFLLIKWSLSRPPASLPDRLASHHPRDDDEPPFA